MKRAKAGHRPLSMEDLLHQHHSGVEDGHVPRPQSMMAGKAGSQHGGFVSSDASGFKRQSSGYASGVVSPPAYLQQPQDVQQAGQEPQTRSQHRVQASANRVSVGIMRSRGSGLLHNDSADRRSADLV